jgi:hypothetical protein
MVKNEIDGCGMVLYIQPVAYVLSFPVYRYGSVVFNIVDGKWYQFFRELVWTVIV